MIRFMKVPPTTYVLQYKHGQIKREGAGISFFYWAPTSTIVAVPLASADVPFAFTETTTDFQAVTIQGQLTYRVADPKRLASLLDFTIDKRNTPYFEDHSRDRQKLPERLVHTLQSLTRAVVQRLPLKELLVSSELIVAEALAKLKESEAVTSMGLEILALSILDIKPTPEMSRALEAEAREALQGRADEAIYARRNAAVENERMIKESELNTEIAVEQKKREIRETQLAAEIAAEQKKREIRETQMASEISVEEKRLQLVARRSRLRPHRDPETAARSRLEGADDAWCQRRRPQGDGRHGFPGNGRECPEDWRAQCFSRSIEVADLYGGEIKPCTRSSSS
jgi:regulator of protease activity HflC (stomatin/prohibitin superfamily)